MRRVEDERNQYKRMKVPGVPLEQVIDLQNRFADETIVCLNTYFKEAVRLGEKTNRVCVDLSFAETFNTVDSLLDHVPADRILLGSHAPFLYTRSAVLKMKGAQVSNKLRTKIQTENARLVFGLK